MPKKISELVHPTYEAMAPNWAFWRSTLNSGQSYIDSQLQKYSKSELKEDFEQRRKITYNPARARGALYKIRNAIFQRLTDVVRTGGSDSYNRAILGLDGGMDFRSASMMSFMGEQVLPSLLGLGSHYIYVDMPRVPEGASVADTIGIRPYLYCYNVEDVRNWVYDYSSQPGEFSSVLLRRTTVITDEYGLPDEHVETYRLMQRVIDGVQVIDFDKNGNQVDNFVLAISRIPLVRVNIGESLLLDIAGHQRAMLQMASSDVNALVKGNFFLYTEQVDPRFSHNLRGPGHPRSDGSAPGNEPSDRVAYLQGVFGDDETSPQREDATTNVLGGPGQGRAYGKGLDRPGFVSPDPGPALASMNKQEAMAKEIRELVDLALTGMAAQYAAAESKRIDQGGLEAGLSYIGLKLSQAENEIGAIWAEYESRDSAPMVVYPKAYSLKTDAERQEEASRLAKLRAAAASDLYKRMLSKQIITTLIGDKVPPHELEAMFAEIDNAPGVESDVDALRSDVEIGLVTTATASRLRGYAEGEAEKAKDEHAERLARIAEAQSSARGVSDAQGSPGTIDKKDKQS